MELAIKLLNVFPGLGNPPIEKLDVFELGFPDVDLSNENSMLHTIQESIPEVVAAANVETEIQRQLGYDRHKPLIIHPAGDFLPVRAVYQDAGNTHFSLLKGQIDAKPRPPGIRADDQVFIFYAPDDRMFPRWRRGEPVFVHPFRPPIPGEHAIVELNHEESSIVYFAKFVTNYQDQLIFEYYNINAQSNGSAIFGFEASRIRAVWRVYEWSELIG